MTSDSDEDSTSKDKKEPEQTAEAEEETVGDMANAVDDDPEIGSLMAHLDGESAQAIVTT